MGLIHHTREADEAILHMLTLRRSKSTPQIGEMFGISSAKVRVITDRVVRDDSVEEGRDTRAKYRFLTNAEAQVAR